MLFGPVFQKEVRTSGRKRGTYVMRSLYGALLLAIAVIGFLSLRVDGSHAGGVQRLIQMQSIAPSMALTVAWFQFIALCLAAPIFTGPAICDEKRARTLPALMTTPLSAAQIVLGTLSSRVVHLLILSLMGAPLLLAVRIFGGLEAEFILGATCVSLSSALLAAALGLMYSAWHKRGTSAAVFGLLTLVLVMGAPTAVEGILYYFLNDLDDYAVAPGQHYKFHEDVLSTCAPAAMAYLSMATVMGMPVKQIAVGSWAVPIWAVNAAYNVAMAGVFTGLAMRALRRIMLREAATGGEAAAPVKKKRKAATPPAPPGEGPVVEAAPEIDTSRDARRTRDVSDRPVLWREVRQNTFGTRRRFAVVAALTLAGVGCVYWLAGSMEGSYAAAVVLRSEGLHATMMVIGAVLVMIQPVFMTTGSIAGEREARTWEVLLTTPLSGANVMLGKYVGALRAQWFLIAVVLGHFLIATVGGYLNPVLLVYLAMIYLGPTLFFTATGQFFSLAVKRTVAAAALNLLTALGVWLISWVVLFIGMWFSSYDPGRIGELISQGLYSLNPVAMVVSAGEGAGRYSTGFSMSGSYQVHGIDSVTLNGWQFLGVVGGAFGFYLVASAAVMWLTVAMFRRLSGRSS